MTISSRKINAFAKLVASLADTPNLGSTATLKQWFDSSPEELRVALNGLIDDLASIVAGSSGAESIGSAPIAGLTGATPYAQLSDLLTKVLTLTNTTVYTPTASYHPATKKFVDDSLATVVAGTIPDNTLTTAKYQDGSVTTAKLANGSVTLAKLNNDMKNMVTMGGMF